MSVLYGNRGLNIVGGQGVRAIDSEGRSYLDFLCGHGAALFGHAHPELVSAIAEASRRPWTIGMGLSAPSRDELLVRLATLVPKGQAYLANSGAEAVEAALKLVLHLRPGRPRILAARRSFHGRTLGALSLTFNPKYRNPWKTCLVPVEFFPVEDLPEAVDSNVAAVFIEPVQGEGGVLPLDPEIGKVLTESCRRHGAILVADEIQSGWGRCGAFLASAGAGLEPDMVTLAKGIAGGLPAGALVWRSELGDFPAMGHGSTYGGNPLVSSVALACWELLERGGLMERSIKVGSFFLDRLRNMPVSGVAQVRGRGLLIGVELEDRAGPVVKALQERGVLSLPAGPKVVRFLPPLVATEEHCDSVVSILEEVLHR